MCKSTPATGWMMARVFLTTVTKWGTVLGFATFKYKLGLAICLPQSSSHRCRAPPFLELGEVEHRRQVLGPVPSPRGIGGENDGT
jgi:hypothetical protein